jgi:ATP:corrinoid adenosyltransferase
MITIQDPKLKKAKKIHICNFCNGDIHVGDNYYYSTHKIDYLYTWKSHTHCSDIVDELKMYEDCDEGVSPETFKEYIINEYNLIANDTTKLLFLDKLKKVLSHHKINYNEQ